MKSLKDQLLKAKLVNKKQARKIEHEERVRQKQLGKEGVRKEKALHRKAQEEKEQKRKLEQQRQNQLQKQMAEVQRTRLGIEPLVTGADMLLSGAGPRRFYFTAFDNSVPFLEISDALAIRLEEGSAAIVALTVVTMWTSSLSLPV